ncbi:MAG: glycosyltransferase [Lachnospiraceae bacterium]|nr:glycosyltransferase [Lachnospiraceae bacterium]
MAVKISVIVPVYNTKEYLEKCIQSLLSQTLEENEIILVDDGSTDGSSELLDAYAESYSKIKVIHIDNGGQGRARNIGIANASGTFLMFCDSDDYLQENAFEKMYGTAMDGGYDLVYAPEYRVRGNNKYILGEMEEPLTKENLILNMSLMSFPSLLVKKDLLTKVGEAPEIVYEDVAYVPVLISNAQNIGYCNTPVYYYVQRSNSTLSHTKEEKILDLRKAVEFAITHIDPSCQDAVIMSMALKEADKVKWFWYFGDVLLEHLWTLEEKIKKNPYYLATPEKYKELTGFLNLSRIPYDKILYVNGFGGQDNQRIQGGFREGGERRVLSEENCDINGNDKIRFLYECKDYESVASYFAMKHILETGGVYVSNDMEITGVFDSTRYFDAFFGYQDEESITDKVFGGRADNEAMRAILECYEREQSLTMPKAMAQTLGDLYQVELNGRTNYVKYPVMLLAPLAVVANAGGRIALTQRKKYDEDIVVVTSKTLEAIYNYPTGWQMGQLRNERFTVHRLRSKLRTRIRQKNERIEEKNERIEELKGKLTAERQAHKESKKELNKIKNSRPYKAGMYLNGSKLGRLIIKICLKLSKE